MFIAGNTSSANVTITFQLCLVLFIGNTYKYGLFYPYITLRYLKKEQENLNICAVR